MSDAQAPPRIFIAAQPKSGSTHLLLSLSRYLKSLDFKVQHCGCNMHLEKGIEAQDILPPLLQAQVEAEELKDRVLVWKQHMMPTPNNLQFLAHFGIRTIVTVRNVPDALQSLYDHFARWQQTPRAEGPMAHRFAMPIGLPVHIDDWERLEAPSRRELLESLFGPWMQWFQLAWLRQRELPVLILNYDLMWKNTGMNAKTIVDFLGVRWDAELAAKAFDEKDQMWNVGTPGRGAKHFRHWPGDFPSAWETLEGVGQEILRLERASLERNVAPDAGPTGPVVPDV
jgi:hypothetical protein